MPRWPARNENQGNAGNQVRNNDNADMEDQGVEFNLRPGHRQGEIIDMNSKPGYNHWKHATEKLDDEFYDCEAEGFYQFMKVLGSRADRCEWTEPGDYGSIDYEQVKSYEMGFIHENSRKAQNTSDAT